MNPLGESRTLLGGIPSDQWPEGTGSSFTLPSRAFVHGLIRTRASIHSRNSA